MSNEPISRSVSEIPGMEDYENYFVTTDGNVYSTKWNKIHRLKPSWAGNKKDGYSIVKLTNNTGKTRSFYVHRLVAKLFILNPGGCWGIEHINGDLKDNSIDNLRWIERKIPSVNVGDRIYLGKDISDYIKLVHKASIQKGIPVPGEVDFFNGMINESLEEFVNRYGLRKVIYQLQSS